MRHVTKRILYLTLSTCSIFGFHHPLHSLGSHNEVTSRRKTIFRPDLHVKADIFRRVVTPNVVGLHLSRLSAVPTNALTPTSLIYMSLLALQFGLQPTLTRTFAPKTICRSTIVIMQEVTKLFLSVTLLLATGSWQSSLVGWSSYSWLLAAGIPATLYVAQNYLSLIAYQNLTPVTFNVLNQTKTLSAAIFCFLIMGRAQSKLQILALFLLSTSALVLEKVVSLPWNKGHPKATTNINNSETHFRSGVLPILAASSISGLAGVSACLIQQIDRITLTIFLFVVGTDSVHS
jgi:Nucleotide-sugar transporter